MLFRRSLAQAIVRRNAASKQPTAPRKFTTCEGPNGRIEIGRQFQINPDLSLPGAFFLFTVAPMLAFDVFAVTFAN